MRTITIENTSRSPRGPVTLHLEHEVYCAAAGDCQCSRQPVGTRVFDAAKQRKIPQVTNQRYPRAITLNAPGTPGSKLSGLHPSAEGCRDVAAALADRKIRVVQDAAEPAAVSVASSPAGEKPVPKAPRKGSPAPDSPPSG